MIYIYIYIYIYIDRQTDRLTDRGRVELPRWDSLTLAPITAIHYSNTCQYYNVMYNVLVYMYMYMTIFKNMYMYMTILCIYTTASVHNHDHVPVCNVCNGSLSSPLGVTERYRRRGVGNHLMTSLLDHVTSSLPDCWAVYLHVLASNTTAIG